MQISMIDISRAYFNAKTDPARPTYVELPAEAGAPPGSCALLRRHMYGTQRAAEGWQDECSSALLAMGFVQGQASACVFAHPDKSIVVTVHGDDFTAAGPKSSLDWYEQQMKQKYELTVGGRLGPGIEDDKRLSYSTASYDGRSAVLSTKPIPGRPSVFSTSWDWMKRPTVAQRRA